MPGTPNDAESERLIAVSFLRNSALRSIRYGRLSPAVFRYEWSWELCQVEGGGPGPPARGGLLSHQGDGGRVGVDRQVRLDGLLGIAQVVHGMSVADGQVGDDVVELALEGGYAGKAW
jgi:hypothetical protein